MPGPWEKYQGTASAAPQGPWTKYAGPDFAANPPAAAGPHVDMHKSFLVGPASDNADTPIQPQDVAKGMVQNAYDLSAPNIANQLVKKHTGVDVAAKVGLHGTELKDIPQEAATTMIPILLGGMDVPEATPVPRGSLAEGVKFAREAPTTPGRLSRLMRQGVKEIPGYGKVSRFVEAWKEPEPAPAPTPPPAPVPETEGVPWGSGGEGPLDLRGKTIPAKTPETPPAAEQSAVPPPAKPTPIAKGQWRKAMDEQLGKALGAKQLDPKVPLRSQVPGRMPTESEPALPEGHKAVDSSALRSYGYKPDVREFEARATSGDTIYVYGDVPPEVAGGFETAESKGQAWAAIRRHPLVAKIVNGKRIAVKPAE